MAIKKFTALKDNTITNAFSENLIDRSTGSNMGASDVLEVFTIYAQGTPPLGENGKPQVDGDGLLINTLEQARVIVEFSSQEIAQKITAGEIPNTGVTYKLNLYNAEHSETLPRNFTIEILPLSKAWTEGIGLDMESYSDPGASKGGDGSDWKNATKSTTWDNEGGDFIDNGYKKTFSFVKGNEDLSVDISDIVQAWLDGDIENYGLMVKLSDTHEQALARTSTYTKKFFARGSEYFYKRPNILATWDSSKKDNRGNFYAESNLRDAQDNTNVLYLNNTVDGTGKNIPTVTSGGANDMTLKVYSDSAKEQEIVPESLTVVNSSAGEYKASIILDTDASEVYLDWEDAGGQVYHTESIKVLQRTPVTEDKIYVSNITNMKSLYSTEEVAMFRLYSRLKDWNPTIYTVSSKKIENNIVENAHYRIVRVVDDEVVISYDESTKLSYDKNGNYFTFDMSLLEPDYAYRIELQYEIGGLLQQQPETFKFRVE